MQSIHVQLSYWYCRIMIIQQYPFLFLSVLHLISSLMLWVFGHASANIFHPWKSSLLTFGLPSYWKTIKSTFFKILVASAALLNTFVKILTNFSSYFSAYSHATKGKGWYCYWNLCHNISNLTCIHTIENIPRRVLQSENSSSEGWINIGGCVWDIEHICCILVVFIVFLLYSYCVSCTFIGECVGGRGR